MASVYAVLANRLSSLSLTSPFSPRVSSFQVATYLVGLCLFGISFLVFLNSTISFLVTDLLGQRKDVGAIVGTLGFVDELAVLVMCPVWGLVSDRIGVRWVSVSGFVILAVSLWAFVEVRRVGWPLMLVRVVFAVGAAATSTMVSAVLPLMAGGDTLAEVAEEAVEAGEDENDDGNDGINTSNDDDDTNSILTVEISHRKSPILAGYVGFFTGCGALLALAIFLPLPARLSRGHPGDDHREEGNTTTAQALIASYRIVGGVALVIGIFVLFGFRNLIGEEEKGIRALWGKRIELTNDFVSQGEQGNYHQSEEQQSSVGHQEPQDCLPARQASFLPYRYLLYEAVRLGFRDSNIALGYVGGFVARASTVAVSLFIPLYVNTYFLHHGNCQKGAPGTLEGNASGTTSPNENCPSAYILASILTGVAQLVGLLCSPLVGYVTAHMARARSPSLSSQTPVMGPHDPRQRLRDLLHKEAPISLNWPIILITTTGMFGYIAFPRLPSPEIKDVDGRGGGLWVLLIMALLGFSQIGAIVYSMGSISRGVLSSSSKSRAVPAWLGSGAQYPRTGVASGPEASHSVYRDIPEDDGEEPMSGANVLDSAHQQQQQQEAYRLAIKGSIAGVYSWCGGLAILILTKVGGSLFDRVTSGAPFYLMAMFNGFFLVGSLLVDIQGALRRV